MRTSLFAVLMFSATASSFAADGTVYFNNRVPGVVLAPIHAPVPGATTVVRQGNAAATGDALIDPFPAGLTDYLGAARLGGTAYTVELWSFDGTVFNPVPGSQRNFRTGAAVGFLEVPGGGGDVTVPGVEAGDTATLMLRAWDNVGGTVLDYSLATTRGESASFAVVLGGTPLVGPALPTPNMDDLRSFSLAEPVIDPCDPDIVAPVVTLVGADPLTVECGTIFADPGATAVDACDASLTVIPSGTVDSSIPGAYLITYDATDDSGNTGSATRTVNVVDTTAPTVTLNGADPITIECGSAFVDPGATATDSCAGPLGVSTAGVVDPGTPGSYLLTYSATDPSGNIGTATRTVNVVDTIAPLITIIGANPLLIECRAIFVDPGATAADVCDGPLPAVPSGSVDVNTPGDYVITYTATDSSGNLSTATRTVRVGACPDFILTCPASITVVIPNDPDQCSAIVTFADPVPTGGTAPVTIVCNPPSGSAFPVGVTTVICTATDSREQRATCSFTITVGDEQPPELVCPPDLTVNCLEDVPPPDFAEGTVSDICDPSPVITHVGDVQSGTDPTIITRTYEATDSSGNSVTCDQIITIQALAGDLNADCCVDRADLDILIAQVRARSTDLTYDLNADGAVNIADARTLVLLFSNPGGEPCSEGGQ